MVPKSIKGSRFVGYVRVSTGRQADKGLSLAAQREQLRKWAKFKGVDLVAVVSDPGVSAGKPLAKRDGGARVLAMLDSGEVDGLVVVKLDRAFRSTADTVVTISERFSDKGGQQFVSLSENIDTSTAMGRFLVTIMAGLAQMEREQTGERIRFALDHLREQGVELGAPPVGYRLAPAGKDGKRYTREVDPEGQRAVRLARRLRAKGASLRDIGRELERRGHRTKRGGTRWHPKVIRSIVGEG